MGAHGAIEVAKTVMEVADVAWTAVECRHHHHNHNHPDNPDKPELESLKSENRRLRRLLEQNLNLLLNLAESPGLLHDYPPDLCARLESTVNSKDFLARLESLNKAATNAAGCEFPFREATEDDIHSIEVLVNADHEEPSWWVWVSDDMVPSKIEERSGIDDQNYMIVNEEHVVDGIANFMAKCIISNPKAQNMKPEELQKTLAKALVGVSKVEKIMNVWHAGSMFYALSTWGLAFSGLYKSRAVLRLAAVGFHTTTKFALKLL